MFKAKLCYSVVDSPRGLIQNLATEDMISDQTFGALASLWYVCQSASFIGR